MNSSRRQFLKTSLAASAATTLATNLKAASSMPAAAGREYYELRAYRLKPGAAHSLLDGYLEKALIPALNARGIKSVGAFTELEVNRTALTSTPKAESPVWVVIPHPSLDSYVTVNTEINTDAAVQKAGADYLQVEKANAVFDRIDTWLLLAFKGMPKLEVPAFSRNKTPTRFFEMRTYESYSELKALAKIAMFHDGEIDVMKDLGMNPVFYGQALGGRDLPHLTYLTSGPDIATHFANWKKFGTEPRWVAIKDLPKYKDTVTKNTSRFLTPLGCSQI